MSKTKIGILLAIFIVAAVIVVIFISTGQDKKGPVISVGSTNMTFTEGDDTGILLKGVTAVDDVDGDVTDSIVIEKMVVVSNGTRLKVTYSACDSKNNVTKSSKVISYIEK